MTADTECLELPRPLYLLRTVGVSLGEAFGLPTVGYALAAWLAGRDAGLWAMLAAIWVTAVVRKLVAGSLPSLLLISLAVLTVQTAAAIATGNLWIFLVHFPIANLGLCVLFARTVRGPSPIAGRLAAEVIGLRCPAYCEPRLHGFFQHVTMLWAGIFLLLAAILGALLAVVPVTLYVPAWAVTTITLIAAGIAASALWLRRMLRRLCIGLRFAAITVYVLPAVREDSRLSTLIAMVTALTSALVLGISSITDQRSTKRVESRRALSPWIIVDLVR